MQQSQYKATPKARIQTESFTHLNHTRTDDYYWLRDKTNPEVINYLNAENAYTDEVMADTKELQQKIYDEIVGRIKEDDESYPICKRGYYYYTRIVKGLNYPIYLRKEGSLDADEQVLFDVNTMAEGKAAFIFGGSTVSPNNELVAYFFNDTGSYAEFTLAFKSLLTDEAVGFTVEGASSVAWANDNDTLFYSVIDDTLRSYRIYRRRLSGGDAELVFEEQDNRFSCSVSRDKIGKHIYISTGSSTTSEEWINDANTPENPFQLIAQRKQDVEYSVHTHRQGYYIYYKDKEVLNGQLFRCGLDDLFERESWQLYVPHRPDQRLDGLRIMKDWVAIQWRVNGLAQIELNPTGEGEPHLLSFPESVYTVDLTAADDNKPNTFRYSYQSLNRPTTLYQYDIASGTSEVLKVKEIPSGFDPDAYEVERLWSEATDGQRVPMAIVYKKGLKRDGSNPTLLYAYGSYGICTDASFSSSFYSLIDRGFIFAIAQIRGGSDLGEHWYEEGKMLHKKNTFTDFIACSEHLIKQGYTKPEHLAIMGGSAGGLLMGAVTNMRPELYRAVVAQVPFVDVVNTMLDPTLPLTTGEYEEWGNPNEQTYYDYIRSYSPYDNIERQDYPDMLVTGGINDSQVLFHEPTKYVAKLRAMKQDDHVLLLHMNMDSGHGGATGMYSGIKDTAFHFAFIIKSLSIE